MENAFPRKQSGNWEHLLRVNSVSAMRHLPDDMNTVTDGDGEKDESGDVLHPQQAARGQLLVSK